jgi:hypothetical protein
MNLKILNKTKKDIENASWLIENNTLMNDAIKMNKKLLNMKDPNIIFEGGSLLNKWIAM